MQSYLIDLKALINKRNQKQINEADFDVGCKQIIDGVTSKVMYRWADGLGPNANEPTYRKFEQAINYVVRLVISIQLFSNDMARSSDNIVNIQEEYLDLIKKIDEVKRSTFGNKIGPVPKLDAFSRVEPGSFRRHAYADMPFFDMVHTAFTSEYYEVFDIYEKAATNFHIMGVVGGIIPLVAVLSLNTGTFIFKQINTISPRTPEPQIEVELAFPQADVPDIFRIQISDDLKPHFTREELWPPAYDPDLVPQYTATDPFPPPGYSEPQYPPTPESAGASLQLV